MKTARRPVALTILAVLVGFGAIKLVRPLGQTFVSSGDVAFIELGVRKAVHLQAQVGVFSRFGWNHPGPALLYALAPWYGLSGESSRSLFLGAWIVNGACAIAVVVIVRARAGEMAARLMAGVVLWFLLIGGFTHLIDPWNVKILAIPTLLFLVAAAGGASGSAWSLSVALLSGTYLVQTHVALLWLVGAVVVAAAVVFVVTTRRDGWGGAGYWPLLVGGLALFAMWLPPVIQQFTGHPANLSAIASFAIDPSPVTPTSHSLREAVNAVSNRVTLVPLGKVPDDFGHLSRKLMTGAVWALGAGVGIAAWRRSRFVALLALTTPVGIMLALLAATRVVGALYAYLFYWCEALPLPALFAAVWLLADLLATRYARLVNIVVLVALVALAGASLRLVALGHTTSFGDSPGSRAIAHRIEQQVGDKQTVFTIDSVIVDGGAVFVTLVKDGYHFRVEPEVIQRYRGNTQRPVTGPAFELRPANKRRPPPLPGTTLMTAAGMELRLRS